MQPETWALNKIHEWDKYSEQLLEIPKSERLNKIRRDIFQGKQKMNNSQEKGPTSKLDDHMVTKDGGNKLRLLMYLELLELQEDKIVDGN